MPSGRKVVVTTWKRVGQVGLYQNIYITPHREDASHATGMCGNYNLVSTDDETEFLDDVGIAICSSKCEKYRLRGY